MVSAACFRGRARTWLLGSSVVGVGRGRRARQVSVMKNPKKGFWGWVPTHRLTSGPQRRRPHKTNSTKPYPSFKMPFASRHARTRQCTRHTPLHPVARDWRYSLPEVHAHRRTPYTQLRDEILLYRYRRYTRTDAHTTAFFHGEHGSAEVHHGGSEGRSPPEKAELTHFF